MIDFHRLDPPGVIKQLWKRVWFIEHVYHLSTESTRVSESILTWHNPFNNLLSLNVCQPADRWLRIARSLSIPTYRVAHYLSERVTSLVRTQYITGHNNAPSPE